MVPPGTGLDRIGPGVITGASDDDPSGIATYSQAGSAFGVGLLWLALWTLPLMIAAQEMCARIGMTSGCGLAETMKRCFPARTILLLSLLLFVANTINIGADLGAMAEAARLILPGPQWAWLVGFAGLTIGLEILVSYRRYVTVLRWLTLALFAYVLAAFFTRPDWWEALRHTVLPMGGFGRDEMYMIVAVLGTTISPYLFFWQASEEVEEEIVAGRTTVEERAQATPGELAAMRADVTLGMVVSNLIMFFIILTTAGTLHRAGITRIDTAAQAASALRPLAGDFAFFLFTLGILGTGLLAIPVLAGSASYAMAEVFGWPEGLGRRFTEARGFYLTMALSIGLGLASNFLGLEPVRFLLFAAVINGLLAPVMLWYIIRLADDSRVVGPHRSPPGIRITGWATLVFMAVAGAVLIVQQVAGFIR